MKEELDKEFEEWMKKKHLEHCLQCRKEGKARLMDSDFLAVLHFREFYKQRTGV